MNRVEEALKAARETRAMQIGCGVITEIAPIFKSLFPSRRAVVVADTTTYRIAGERVETLLREAGVELEPKYIFDDPNLYAEYHYIDMLVEALSQHDAVPIAVGSGTINDLTKLSSSLTNRGYICVATAASMDGYTAFGASITAHGAKQTFNCPAPSAVVADIDIIKGAPQAMTASGYADLFAKVTAGADWIISDELGIEPIDERAWSIVQDGLHDALCNPRGAASGESDSVYALSEGLMLGGFAMQWSKSSRPASGAEHQFSHLWNMENHLNNGEHISHGFQVSIGMLAITALYEQFMAINIDDLDIDKCVAAWKGLDQIREDADRHFGDSEFIDVAYTETEAKYVSKEVLREKLTLLKSRWGAICARLKAQITPFDQVRESLKCVGAPYEPEHIGLTRQHLRDTFIRAQFIRRRFTILDLVLWCNLSDAMLDGLFGAGGVWEIKNS